MSYGTERCNLKKFNKLVESILNETFFIQTSRDGLFIFHSKDVKKFKDAWERSDWDKYSKVQLSDDFEKTLLQELKSWDEGQYYNDKEGIWTIDKGWKSFVYDKSTKIILVPVGVNGRITPSNEAEVLLHIQDIYAYWKENTEGAYGSTNIKDSDLPNKKELEDVAKKFKIESDIGSDTSTMNHMLNRKASNFYDGYFRIGPWRYSGDKDWLINTKTLKWYHNEYDWDTWSRTMI